MDQCYYFATWTFLRKSLHSSWLTQQYIRYCHNKYCCNHCLSIPSPSSLHLLELSVQTDVPYGCIQTLAYFTRHAVFLSVIHNATAFLAESTSNLTLSSAPSLEQVNYTMDNSEYSHLEVQCSRVLGNV